MLSDRHFDRLYTDNTDPWGYRSRWYEQRKRSLTLAALPRSRFRSGIEAGCANGELAAALAERCDRLLACDYQEKAVELARLRLVHQDRVRIERRRLPEQWPQQRFDLIVLSEVGYYLKAPALHTLVRAAAASLEADGVLLACHWRHPVEDAFLSGDEVHEILQRDLGLERQVEHVERDLRLDVWSCDGRSVAQREGLA